MSIRSRYLLVVCSLIAAAALSIAPLAPAATTVIGDFEGGPNGWIDWNTGAPRVIDESTTNYAFNGIGTTTGSSALQYTLPGGYLQWAALKLQMGGDFGNGVDEWRDEFMASQKLSFDLTLVDTEMTLDPANNFANIGIFVNADGFGFTRIPGADSFPESITGNEDGYITNNGFNPQNLVGTRTFTWTYDIEITHDGITDNPADIAPNPGYVEIILETYSNGPVVYHLDNVRLTSTPTLSADFNGVNGVNAADLAIWKTNIGLTGQTNNANGDADADGDVDGADVLLWQQQNGSTGGASPAIGAVPEPASALLAAMGIVAAWRRKRGRSAA